MPAVGGPGRQQPPCSTEQESLAPGEEGRATGASTHCHAGGSASLHGGHVREKSDGKARPPGKASQYSTRALRCLGGGYLYTQSEGSVGCPPMCGGRDHTR